MENLIQQLSSLWEKTDLSQALTSCLIINISFYLTCYWIYSNEVSGNWEKYRINLQPVTGVPPPVIDLAVRKQLYKSQIKSVLFDLGFIMPLVFFLASPYLFEGSTTSNTSSLSHFLGSNSASKFLWDCGRTFVAYLLFRLWSFAVHMLFHRHPSFIKYHKQHHLPMSQMTCVSTFTDSLVEFLFMELFAEVAGICFVGGLPLFHVCLLGCYNVANGAFDHSGFVLEEYWLNSIYHYVHHARPTVNLAELTYIDRLFGFYVDYAPELVVESFRTKKSIQSAKANKCSVDNTKNSTENIETDAE